MGRPGRDVRLVLNFDTLFNSLLGVTRQEQEVTVSSVRELLEHAIAASAIVTVVYNGGSRPGQARPLIPLSLHEADLVAREPTFRAAKTFKLAKIASVILGAEAAANVAPAPVAASSIPQFETLTEYAAHLKGPYTANGWNVFAEPTCFSVSGFFKSGKPKKSATVSIQLMDRRFETGLDLESGEFVTIERELTGRERPWRVESKRMPQAKAFADLQKAMEYFVNEVEASDPSR